MKIELIAGFWSPLEIFSANQNLLWNNPLPNSILFARPVFLVREKETWDSVSDHFKPNKDKLAAMEKESGRNFYDWWEDATKEDANNIAKIADGFLIGKTAEKCLLALESVESGEISYSDKERAGQVHKPLHIRDIRYYGITHQKLGSLDNMEKLMYQLVSRQKHTWSERN